MKVILLKDVSKVGRKFEVVEVNSGYAANFLLPKRYAEMATPARLAELTKRKEVSQAAEDARRAELAEKLAELKENPLTLVLKADEQGHLYKKVHAHDIAKLLKEERGISLDETSILLEAPLHELGEYPIPLEASGNKATLTLSIVAE